MSEPEQTELEELILRILPTLPTDDVLMNIREALRYIDKEIRNLKEVVISKPEDE